MANKALIVELPGYVEIRERLEEIRAIREHLPDLVPLFQEYSYRRVFAVGVVMMIRSVFHKYAGGSELVLRLYRVASVEIIDALVDNEKVAERAKSLLRSLSKSEKMGVGSI